MINKQDFMDSVQTSLEMTVAVSLKNKTFIQDLTRIAYSSIPPDFRSNVWDMKYYAEIEVVNTYLDFVSYHRENKEQCPQYKAAVSVYKMLENIRRCNKK